MHKTVLFIYELVLLLFVFYFPWNKNLFIYYFKIYINDTIQFIKVLYLLSCESKWDDYSSKGLNISNSFHGKSLFLFSISFGLFFFFPI